MLFFKLDRRVEDVDFCCFLEVSFSLSGFVSWFNSHPAEVFEASVHTAAVDSVIGLVYGHIQSIVLCLKPSWRICTSVVASSRGPGTRSHVRVS